MAGYESDEFISYDFDDSYVYRKPTGDRFVVYIMNFVYFAHSCS